MICRYDRISDNLCGGSLDLRRDSVIIMQFNNFFSLKISSDRGLFANCIAISGVGVLSFLFSFKTDLTGNFSLLNSSLTLDSVIDIGKFLIIAEMSFSILSL